MSSMMETLLGFAGGLALFIYGMNQMGDGLKKVAGEKNEKDSGGSYNKSSDGCFCRDGGNRHHAKQ
jgi:hypothetical protein